MRETLREYFELQYELRSLLKNKDDNTNIKIFGINALFGKLLIVSASLFNSTIIVSMGGMESTMEVSYFDDEIMTEINNYLRSLLYNIKIFI